MITYKKGVFIIYYKNKILFTQKCLRNNKAFTYLYIYFLLIKLGLVNLLK